MADGSGAGGQTLGEELLVFEDEALELAFLGGECVESLDIELPETFDVDRAAILRVQRLDWAGKEKHKERETNLVHLVIVLGVILVDLLFLLEVKVAVDGLVPR